MIFYSMKRLCENIVFFIARIYLSVFSKKIKISKRKECEENDIFTLPFLFSELKSLAE